MEPQKKGLLRQVAENPANKERILGYQEILGFLFVIASAPETVAPSEFLPIIFNSDDEVNLDFLPPDIAAHDLLQEIMGCYNDIVSQLHANRFQNPPGYQKPTVIASLFEAENELSLWAKGFVSGFTYLEEDWNYYLAGEEKLSEELGAAAMVLSFFSDIELAQEYYAESKSKKGFESFAQDMHDLLPKALASYASIGWGIHKNPDFRAKKFSQ
jgi:yecA family protein